MAAGHEDFVKLAFRSFAMLDNCYGSRPKRASTRPSLPPPPYRPPAAYSNASVIDSNEAARLYGGIVITEHTTSSSGYKKVINCNEAAQLYGGIVISEYATNTKKQLQFPN